AQVFARRGTQKMAENACEMHWMYSGVGRERCHRKVVAGFLAYPITHALQPVGRLPRRDWFLITSAEGDQLESENFQPKRAGRIASSQFTVSKAHGLFQCWMVEHT